MSFKKKIWLGTVIGAIVPFTASLFIFSDVRKIFVSIIWLVVMTVVWARSNIKLIKNEIKPIYGIRLLKTSPFRFSLVNAMIGSIVWVIMYYIVLA